MLYIPRTILQKVVISVHQLLVCKRIIGHIRKGLFPREGFQTSRHTYCPLGDDLNTTLAPMEINRTASSFWGWEGEGAFLQGSRKEEHQQCMLQGALSSLWAGLFPHPHSYLLICALCCFLFCCMAPAQNLGRALQGKAGRAILGFVLAFFSDACRAFSTFIAYDCTVDNPSDACYKIKKQSPIPNKINSNGPSGLPHVLTQYVDAFRSKVIGTALGVQRQRRYIL